MPSVSVKSSYSLDERGNEDEPCRGSAALQMIGGIIAASVAFNASPRLFKCMDTHPFRDLRAPPLQLNHL
ncbi:hypothetical protein BDV36DRAFT_253716 [Aspergillus pseudocaelatus]|uniref:Uncharacterized protein n=1 Tax=Aspergillus pseudocaelatus TaxID=1825620 RepID=A0ABQ6WN86_9EURO|nr:hypothetical protein BDV36DRAFT_253716 [Aspergillus pseudocaelatus]